MVSGSYDVNNETHSEAASLVASHLTADDEILNVVRCEECLLPHCLKLTVGSIFLLYQHCLLSRV